MSNARMNALGQPIASICRVGCHHRFPLTRHCPDGSVASSRSPPARAGTVGGFSRDTEGRNWTYLAQGPFASAEDFAAWVAQSAASSDPQFYTVFIPPPAASAVSAQAVAVAAAGVASYLRIAPSAGTIEVGHIHFSPLLQHTPAATEAMYLMMRRAFELGYRRA